MPTAAPGEPPRVTFVVHSAWGTGGVARVTATLANALCADHEVHVLSLFRPRPRLRFPLDERVRLTYLLDTRPAVRERPGSSTGLEVDEAFQARLDALEGQDSAWTGTVHEEEWTAVTDLLLEHALAQVDRGVVVSTRPSLHLAATRWVPAHVPVVGHDHFNFPTRWDNPLQRSMLPQVLPRLDTFVVLTDADAADYARAVPGLSPVVMRNPVAWPVPPLAGPDERGPVVLAAGRLVEEKGFDRLLDAWALVAPRHPGWRLEVHGQGGLRDELEAQVAALGLEGTASLAGFTGDIAGRMRTASVFAMASRAEGFPLVLLEALASGLPLVAMDCPRGPAEILTTGNGRLVPDGDVPAMAAALDELLSDDALRAGTSRQAWEDAHAYAPDVVADRWRVLLADVAARPTARGGAARG